MWTLANEVITLTIARLLLTSCNINIQGIEIQQSRNIGDVLHSTQQLKGTLTIASICCLLDLRFCPTVWHALNQVDEEGMWR